MSLRQGLTFSSIFPILGTISGIGTALVRALSERARECGCTGMWVLTDRDNPAALATYRAAGASEESDHVMLGWELGQGG